MSQLRRHRKRFWKVELAIHYTVIDVDGSAKVKTKSTTFHVVAHTRKIAEALVLDDVPYDKIVDQCIARTCPMKDLHGVIDYEEVW